MGPAFVDMFYWFRPPDRSPKGEFSLGIQENELTLFYETKLSQSPRLTPVRKDSARTLLPVWVFAKEGVDQISGCVVSSVLKSA